MLVEVCQQELPVHTSTEIWRYDGCQARQLIEPQEGASLSCPGCTRGPSQAQ